MNGYKIFDHNMPPDPSWKHYQLWEELTECKTAIRELLMFVADTEDADESSDETIKDAINNLKERLDECK